jgi:putative ABC transport system permease protein
MLGRLGQAMRALRRRPLFNSLLFLLLTLGATAFGTVFVLVNATALRPLPFRDSDRLYSLATLEPTGPNRTTQFVLSMLQIRRWREGASAFDRIEAYTPTNPKLTGDGEPESLRGAALTGGLMELMGGTATLGRIFRQDEDLAGSDAVILSHGYWQRRFGGDSTVLGTRLTIDDVPRTVIGVMPASFTLFFRDADVFTPLALTPQQAASPTLRILPGIGHLREGATVEEAATQLKAVNASLAVEFPRVFPSSVAVITPLRQALLGTQRSTVYLLLGAVVMLFLIACANALNLTFADAVARRTATMTRLALGATRGHIAAIRVTETLIVGLISGALAVVFGMGTLALLKSVNTGAFAGMGTVDFEPSSIIATIAIAVVSAGVISMVVAAGESRVSVSELAGSVAKSVGNRTDRRRRSVLLAAQVAVTLILVCGTALLLRNVQALLATSPGFQPSNVLVAPMTISTQLYPTPPEKANHVQKILDAVRGVPGVKFASTIQSRFVLAEAMNAPFDVQEFPSPTGQSALSNIRHSTPDLTKTLGMRIVQGRMFDETDRIDGPPVVVVNEAFAKAYLPGGEPVGKHMRRASNPPGPWMEVIGVVNDVMDAGLGYQIGPAFYVSYLQQNTPTARVTLLVRTEGEPTAQARGIKNAVWSVDPNQIIESVSSMDNLLSVSAAQPKFQALVTAFFAVVALILALVGIYVVTLHDVLQLAREFGVRSALGAGTGDLLRLAVRGSLRPVVIGAAIGALAVVPVVSLMGRVVSVTGATAIAGVANLTVPTIRVGDVPILLGAALLLVGGAAFVALIAGRRVSRIDPAVAMRAG